MAVKTLAGDPNRAGRSGLGNRSRRAANTAARRNWSASDAAPPAPARSAGWWLSLAGIFLLACVWRLFYLHRLESTPLSGSLNADARVYWDWAGALLQNGPLGRNPFFMGPLYPYVLAVLRLILGNSPGAVLVVQSVWGAAAAVLLADAARRLTRPAAGLAIGLLIAGYEMAVFFDGLVLMESLLFFLESLLVWVIVREDWNAPRRHGLVGIGLLTGILAQGRATSVLLLIPIAWLVLRSTPGFKQAGRRFLMVLAAFLAVSTPAALRNYRVSGEWIPFTYSLGLNLFVGANPEATGGYIDFTTGWYPPMEFVRRDPEGGVGDGRDYLQAVDGLDLGPTESSRYWAGRARDWVREHPTQAARLTVRKLGMLWNWREYSQIEDAHEFRAVVGILGLPWIGTFAFVGVLALAGVARALRAGRIGRFVVAYPAVMTIAILPFFVTDRYRHHIVPGAALLAAFAIAEMARLFRERAPAGLLRLGSGLIIGVAIVSWPLPGLDSTRVAFDIARDLGDRWLEKGRPDQALRQYARAIAIEARGQLAGSESRAGCQARAELYVNAGTSYLLMGQAARAADCFDGAFRLAPGAPQVGLALAEAAAVAGRVEEARARYAELNVPVENGATSLARKAWVASRVGQLRAAEGLLVAAVALDSTDFRGWSALIRLRVRLERFDQARDALRRARRSGYAGPGFLADQSIIAAAEEDSKDER